MTGVRLWLARNQLAAFAVLPCAFGWIFSVIHAFGGPETSEPDGTIPGPRSFQTRLDEWPRVLPTGGILIPDVGGDLYHVRAAREFDAQSQRLLWAFVD